MNTFQGHATEGSGEAIALKSHFVLLIDILGQQRHLDDWRTSQVASPRGATPDLLNSVNRSAGTVCRLREDFMKFFQGRLKASRESMVRNMNKLLLSSQPDRDRHEGLTQPELKLLQFSDTFVAYSPSTTPQGDLSVGALFSLVGCACMLAPLYWARNVPLRGSLVIGHAGEFPDIGFYGPALAQAHHLESRVAKYPRIVVSEYLWQGIQSSPPMAENDLFKGFIHDMLGLTGKLLGTDGDDERIIDYLVVRFQNNIAI